LMFVRIWLSWCVCMGKVEMYTNPYANCGRDWIWPTFFTQSKLLLLLPCESCSWLLHPLFLSQSLFLSTPSVLSQQIDFLKCSMLC
jgi:hypothetical protein